ncbi:MAG: hypothetical protein JSS79_05250 [Bacteroidetes bacterium]|nr:hypothetical protein [Bacteroidota bacterium]
MENLHVINENLKKFVQQNSAPQLGAENCVVFAVDITNFTIDCVGQATGKVHYEVPLVTQLGVNKSVVPIPEIDSIVTVVQYDKLNSFVALTGQLTQLYVTSPEVITTIDTKFQIVDSNAHVEFDVLPNGMKLVVDGQSLKDAITDLKNANSEIKSAMENLTVMTSTGASSVPINIADITNAYTDALNAFTKILSVYQ